MKFLLILVFLLVITSCKYYPAEYDFRFEPDYRKCNFKVSEEVYQLSYTS